MNEQEQEKFEMELRRAQPASPPEDFMARLRAARPAPMTAQRKPVRTSWAGPGWWEIGRWLAPALGLAAVALCLMVWRGNSNTPIDAEKGLSAVAFDPKADDVHVDAELVSSYDVVAKLPSGEPVRFRCRRWNDQLVVKDKTRGLEIQESSPRIEVVPVRFETY